MGNSNTKESRSGDNWDGARHDGRGESGRSRNLMSRGDLGGLLNLQSTARDRDRDRQDAPFERRETRQEREARRLERERVARAKEREHSMREEHVDGGYLVTLGTYTGTEDFSKPVVRSLQIERKLAPFWQGLNEWSESWAEHQLIAAARGLPVPAADAPPDPELVPRPPPPESTSTQYLSNSTVGGTLSTASDRGESPTSPGLPSPTSTAAAPVKNTLVPRAKALAAALSVSSHNMSSTDLAPREISLPNDPIVNGQPIEVFLYKDASECPICFLLYPPYLNRTRCCDQPICSECFVQIKRADPHLPEHHPDGQVRDPTEGLTPEDRPEMLTSEPSACPYCQQPEFGVTYDPPPFRRGLVLSTHASNIASSMAMSSQSSLNSTLPPTSPQHMGRRRTHSLSATAPNVITTDRIRPDWATKLAAARAHQARRAAAATALHTAAFLVGGSDHMPPSRPSRFGRRNAGSTGTNTPGLEQGGSAIGGADGLEPGDRDVNRNPDDSRRTRMEELEEMMFMEAVRLSLATEEERKRKEEKALRKEAKKRQQAERKAQKKQGKDPYGGDVSGASGSSLSLHLGRRRGSAASNLRMEATVLGASQASMGDDSPTMEHENEDGDDTVTGKGKGVDRGPPEPVVSGNSSAGSLPITTPGNTRAGSHLRQMSNASSLGSSPVDTPSGSYSGQGFVGRDGGHTPTGGRSDDGDRDTGHEPMFNFRSLAELVGVNIEDGSAHPGEGEGGKSPSDAKGVSDRPLSQMKEEEAETEHLENASDEAGCTSYPQSAITLPPQVTRTPETSITTDAEKGDARGDGTIGLSPEATLTPGTPAPDEHSAAGSERLGHSSVMEQSPSIAQ
ncbi:Protein SIP5 [Tolypocladium capitatum]|uniref:Protein SIP5 n=1 Tax=Tolypocladium capitatum TaxID=45235 RepID=A0A2K3QCB7_9HYPO|nr:Protein SIP5 [Tolypocladium capitatum]